MPTISSNIPNKDATCIVLDVSHTIPADHLRLAKFIATREIENSLLVGSSQNLFGLILTGTVASTNADGFNNILTMAPMMRASTELVDMINGATPFTAIGDHGSSAGSRINTSDCYGSDEQRRRAALDNTNVEVLDSVLAGLTLLLRSTEKTHNFNRKIILVTYGDGTVHGNVALKLAEIVKRCKDDAVSLSIVGLGFLDENLFDPADADHHENWSNWHNLPQKVQTERGLMALAGEIMVKRDQDGNKKQPLRYKAIRYVRDNRGKIIREFGAKVVSGAAAREAFLAQTIKKSIQIRPLVKLLLHFGPDVAIATAVYVHNSKHAAPRFEQAGPRGELVKAVRRYYSLANPDVDLPEDKRIRAFRYGRNVVPVSEVDQVRIKFQSTKGIEVVAFVPLSRVPTHCHMGPTRLLAPIANDDVGTAVMRRLVVAMKQMQNCVALLRFVFRDNSDPLLCAAYTPYVDKPDYDPSVHGPYLLFVQIPFAEDFRQMSFADFSSVTFSKEQRSAMDHMIEAMTIPTASTAAAAAACSETEQEREIPNQDVADFFLPPRVSDPALQLHYYMVREKLHSGCIVPPLTSETTAITTTTATKATSQGAANDDEQQFQVPQVDWHVPDFIRRNCGHWGQEGNILHGFFNRTDEARRAVRRLFPSETDLSSSPLTMNSALGRKRFTRTGENGIFSAGGIAGPEHPSAWFFRSEVALKLHRSDEESSVSNSGSVPNDAFIANLLGGSIPPWMQRGSDGTVLSSTFFSSSSSGAGSGAGAADGGAKTATKKNPITEADPNAAFLDFIRHNPRDFDAACAYLEEVVVERLLPLGNVAFTRIRTALETMKKECALRGVPDYYNDLIAKYIRAKCATLADWASHAKQQRKRRLQQQEQRRQGEAKRQRKAAEGDANADDLEDGDEATSKFRRAEDDEDEEEETEDFTIAATASANRISQLDPESTNFIDFTTPRHNYFKAFMRTGLQRLIIRDQNNEHLPLTKRTNRGRKEGDNNDNNDEVAADDDDDDDDDEEGMALMYENNNKTIYTASAQLQLEGKGLGSQVANISSSFNSTQQSSKTGSSGNNTQQLRGRDRLIGEEYNPLSGTHLYEPDDEDEIMQRLLQGQANGNTGATGGDDGVAGNEYNEMYNDQFPAYDFMD